MTPKDAEGRRRTGAASQLGANCPKIRKGGLVQRFEQILSSRRTASSSLRPDRPLHHLHVPIPPLHKSLIEIHEPLGDLRDGWILAIDVDEKALHLGRWLDRQRHVTAEQRCRNRVTVGSEIMQERIPQRGLRKPRLDTLPVRTALGIALEGRPALFAQHEFDLAKLMGLKATARLEAIAEREKIERRHRLEHIDLCDQGL